jgi:heterodisulfide reductase subunit B
VKIAYYPGCTLKTKAKNLEDSAIAALAKLGIETVELERWNCCGAVYSLADDDLIHQVAPVRVLTRAKDQGFDKVMTLCSQCYNTLARANRLMKEDEEKAKTLNLFMDEESGYHGEVEVVHMLQVLRDELGWDEVKKKVEKPLDGMKVAPFYGCTLLRPTEVSIDEQPFAPSVMNDFLAALGATPTQFGSTTDCCGAYEVLINPDAAVRQSGDILVKAQESGVEAIALSCPLCEYNLGHRQPSIMAARPEVQGIPVYYFSQLLAIAMGVADAGRFDLNNAPARDFAKERFAVA